MLGKRESPWQDARDARATSCEVRQRREGVCAGIPILRPPNVACLALTIHSQLAASALAPANQLVVRFDVLYLLRNLQNLRNIERESRIQRGAFWTQESRELIALLVIGTEDCLGSSPRTSLAFRRRLHLWPSSSNLIRGRNHYSCSYSMQKQWLLFGVR